jgi:hypothetical protein
MLSRLPGATNLPSSPMMMPAMMTPIISTADAPKTLIGPLWGTSYPQRLG